MSEVLHQPTSLFPVAVNSSEPTIGPRPWEQPWWKPTRGSWPTFGWIILIHLTAIAGFLIFPWPGWKVFVGALLLAWLGGFGTTVAYHRAIAHRSVKLNPIVRQFLTFLAMLNGSGSPLSWAANHRHHHTTADTPEDISSPYPGGFWWSHLRWLWQAPKPSEQHYCKDLQNASYRVWTPLQIPVLAVAFFGGLAFGWAGFFWLGAIRLVYSLHAQCCVNSVCHYDSVTPAPGEDTSRNVWWLSLAHLFQGENWHRNHHRRPGSARLGWRWWQVDLGWWLIVVLQKFHLAKHVRQQELASVD